MAEILEQRVGDQEEKIMKINLGRLQNQIQEINKRNLRMKKLFVINYLVVQVPLLSFLMAYLIVKMLTN